MARRVAIAIATHPALKKKCNNAALLAALWLFKSALTTQLRHCTTLPRHCVPVMPPVPMHRAHTQSPLHRRTIAGTLHQCRWRSEKVGHPQAPTCFTCSYVLRPVHTCFYLSTRAFSSQGATDVAEFHGGCCSQKTMTSPAGEQGVKFRG
jgi:hypothetical protein